MGRRSRKKSAKKQKILDIFSRLNLPHLIKPSSLGDDDNDDDDDDDDEEETLEFYIRPRRIFVSSLCLVCLNLSQILCPDCKMVSYCSENHLYANRQSHEQLCRALMSCDDDATGMQLPQGFAMAKSQTPDLYRLFRIKAIAMVEEKMGRQLDLCEREILLYPRICRTCNNIDEHYLTCCQACGMDFYCSAAAAAGHHQQEHLRWCKDLQVFRKILEMQQKYGHVVGGGEPDIPVVYEPPQHTISSLNFDSLIYQMYENNQQTYRKIDCLTYANLSYIATAPLTALYALQQQQQQLCMPNWQTRETMCIHVIGAEFQFECTSLRIWEKLFLHFLPKLKHLTLEFSGPELVLPAPTAGQIKMCRKCKTAGRSIDIVFHQQQLYHHITTNNTRASRPDLICLFNPGLYRETGFNGADTWPQTIRKFCQAQVPVVITSYTEFEIPQDIARTKAICNNLQVILEPQKNPFAAVKPDRNFVSDNLTPLMYKNYCLCIVKGLL